MYSIKVNDSFSFETTLKKDVLSINNNEVKADISKLGAGMYHIISKNQSYRVEVVSLDRAVKTAEIKVNGNTYQVKAKDQFDALLEQLGMSNLNSNKVADIKAPMPGLVLKVLVAEGAEVKKGDNLFVLEAMKMENIIKAPADAIIKSIKIKPADKVEKGQLLILFS
ncbi:acetyl-CoA carboxylase biotin carboxyl carrier protein subunit [Mucilaginibacter sp. PPCGB 2223]|uniref:biotin/lipoyl-containing protein n=1 Tax=Mucilaginibacter sp. PPCGB 2223 TaxID=1886027 RepID=UPI000824659E|nr:acetyl-CoA carboxylase biotin carboxyl carrier protein subunit [Mucilaginibacter sp. PPCGB 2223]OCX50599.1 acetyl-CoA carboxylase biotin carboxyl carrier protein subunit [Mucilaginibacter sp. PPCGB 2223]